jgi:tetratricopeptide (TPR) repeat protein
VTAFFNYWTTAILLLLLAGPVSGQQRQPPEFETLLADAQQAQAAKNYAAAANDYRKALKLQGDISELWANLGLMEHETGDYAAAIASFEQAKRLKSSLYVPQLFLGIDYLRTGKAKQAIPYLLAAKKMNDTDPLPSLTLGRAYSSLGKLSAAIPELRRATELDPKQGSAWFALGIAYLDQMESDSRTMTGQNADSSYGRALLAESLVKQSRYTEAAGQYQSVLAGDNQPLCMRSEQGFLDLRQDDAQAAASEFTAERKLHPECMLALLGLARLRIDAGESDDALAILNQAWNADQGFFSSNASTLFEGMPSVRATRFLSFADGQQSSGGIEPGLYAALSQPPGEVFASTAVPSQPAVKAVVEKAGSQAPTVNASATLASANKDYSAGRYGDCAARLESHLSGHDADALQLLALCSFLTARYELTSDATYALRKLPSQPTASTLYWAIKANERLAFESLARYQELEPDSARSHILLGDIYRQRDRAEDAQKEYSSALTLSPNDPAALLGLATAYLQEAKVEQAVETAQKVLDRSPADPDVNLVMGEALVTQHKFSEAEPFLRKALNVKPQVLPHVHALLGRVYEANGKTNEAIDQLKMGAESDQDGSIHYQLARLYSQVGDKADADAAFAQMKAIKQKRREGAVIALADSHPSSLDDAP